MNEMLFYNFEIIKSNFWFNINISYLKNYILKLKG